MRNDYEGFALEFAQSRESMRWAEFEVMYQFFDRFEGEGDLTIMDIGCGSGRFFAWINTHHPGVFTRLHGVEPATAFHPILSERFASSHGMSFEVAAFHDFSCEPESWSHITALASFHHLEGDSEPLQALDRIHTALAPSGIYAMTNWNLSHPQWRERYEGYFVSESGILYADIPFEGSPRRYRVYTHGELQALIDPQKWEILLHADTLCGEKNIITLLQKKQSIH